MDLSQVEFGWLHTKGVLGMTVTHEYGSESVFEIQMTAGLFKRLVDMLEAEEKSVEEVEQPDSDMTLSFSDTVGF